MLEVYAPQVASLPPNNFAMLMQSLEFGLQHADPVVVQASLEGLAGNRRRQYHYNMIAALCKKSSSYFISL
jgi:hypothetical protein